MELIRVAPFDGMFQPYGAHLVCDGTPLGGPALIESAHGEQLWSDV